MSRLQRLALLNLITLFLLAFAGGALRAISGNHACGDVWARCVVNDGAAALGVVAWFQLFLAMLTSGVTLALALLASRLGGVSSRSRAIAGVSAALIVGQRLLEVAVAASVLPEAVLTAGPMLTMVLLAAASFLWWSLARDCGAPAWLAWAGREPLARRDETFVWLTRLGVAALLLVIATGAVTGGASESLPCSSWPLCVDGGFLPEEPTAAAGLQMAHRLVTALAAVVLLAAAIRAWTRPTALAVRRLTTVMAALLVVQVLLGGNLVVAGGPAWLSVLHLVASIALWLVAVAIAVLASQPATVPAPSPLVADRGGRRADGTVQPVAAMQAAGPAEATMALDPVAGALDLRLPDHRAIGAVISDYVALTKPGIMSLLLVTTFAAILIAASGLPPFMLICVTIIGGVLAAGGANVLNCYIDHDIDAQMNRTRHRASAAGRIPLPHVLAFGVALTVLSVLLLGVGANWLAALLALAGNVYYVGIYTMWLKRRTPHNIVIGGAAGAVPPLVGWAAVTGDLSPIAWGLFLIVFMWTPPHSWALALLKQGEYGRASVPMLPVVAGEAATRRQIVVYSALLALVCLALVPLGLGPIYLVAAAAINAVFLGLAIVLYARPSKRHARRLFFWSLWYLALIFLAAVVDRLILG